MELQIDDVSIEWIKLEVSSKADHLFLFLENQIISQDGNKKQKWIKQFFEQLSIICLEHLMYGFLKTIAWLWVEIVTIAWLWVEIVTRRIKGYQWQFWIKERSIHIP